MKFTLKDYQRDAVLDALKNLDDSRDDWKRKARKSAFSLTAVTGAGKTVMAAAALEALLNGDDELNFDSDPGAVVIWFSDDPSLNEQTRFRLMEASDRINHSDMVVVGNLFNQARFEAGKIYFLNTQKLSKNSLLVRGHDSEELANNGGDLLPETRPDLRAFTIWDTIQNTIEDPSLTLYLVLDEAHRGMGKATKAAEKSKSTIVQRLINGSGGIPGIPVVWGISATVERFDQAIESAGKHIKLPNVVVDAIKVQESGLIKDTILLDCSDDDGDFDTVLVRRAADKLNESSSAWAAYVKEQGESHQVIPLLILQVPNTPNTNEIGKAIDTILERYPKLPTNSIAHVFGDHTTQQFGNHTVPYIEPQRVQESTWVRVLIAKDAISTGWDCPRAEVMVSFRSASDETHITQLLGRMIRSPLARRIPGNDRLNSVECLLPKFKKNTVEKVANALMNGGESGPSVGRILIDYVEMKPNAGVSEELWKLFESLPSQTRPQRGAKPAKRLTALAHELSADEILANAGKVVHGKLHEALDKFIEDNKGKIDEKRKSVLTVDVKTISADLKNKTMSFNEYCEKADTTVIDDFFRRAARVLSPDIAKTYVEHLALKVASPKDPEEFLEAISKARVTIGGLGLAMEIATYIDETADQITKKLLITHATQIKKLSDDRKECYREIIEMSADPQSIELIRPESRIEATKAVENGVTSILPTWESHLLCDENGKFPAVLNDWEQAVLSAESKRDGFMYWYRNPQQAGQSSLGMSYMEDTEYKIMRPDFVFFAEEQGEIVADIVDPHGIHLADALPKLQGLSEYAENYEKSYRRIISIAEVNKKLRQLNLTSPEVRKAIENATSTKSLFESNLANDYPK